MQEILAILDELVRIGAPTFQEKRRVDFIEAWLLKHAPGVIPGRDEDGNLWVDLSDGVQKVHIFDAHTDTVFPDEIVEIRKEAEHWHALGIFDDTVACALLMEWVRRTAAKGGKVPFLVTFTVGEEGEGNLLGARRMAEQFCERALDAWCFDLGTKSASHTAVGSLRHEVEFTVQGGHSWGDFGRPNALHEAARWIMTLESEFPWENGERTFNVGTMEGGSGVNVIAATARFKLDVRSISPEFLSRYEAWLEEQKVAFDTRDDLSLSLREIGRRPAGSLSAFGAEKDRLVGLVEAVNRELGLPLQWACYSTNGNAFFAKGVPTMVTGLANGAGVHTRSESLELASVALGWEKLERIASKLLE